MSRLAEAVRAFARHEIQRQTWCELGVVTAVTAGGGPDAHTCAITLKDSGAVLPRVERVVGLTGAAALPREGDVVVIAFPRGDLASAVIVGTLYGSPRRPPAFELDEAVLQWPGDVDDPESEAVVVRVSGGDPRGLKIDLGGDLAVQVGIADGEIRLVTGDVRVRLSRGSDSDGRVQVEAGGSVVTLDQDGDVTVEAKGDLVLKGTNVAIEGSAEVTINGASVGIN